MKDIPMSLAGAMLAAYIFVRHAIPRFIIPLILLAGTGVAFFQGKLQVHNLGWELSTPVWVSPDFTLHSLVGVGIPLFIVTMASQNVPGVAVLRANSFDTPVSPLISWTGFTGLILAPFGGFAFNLAAISAAICMGEEAGHNRAKRYFAAVWAGFFYLLTGLFGATVVGLFSAFPEELVMAVAGLALLGSIGNSLSAALADQNERGSALLTFLVTASGVNLVGIGSAFWGLMIGLVAFFVQKYFYKHV